MSSILRYDPALTTVVSCTSSSSTTVVSCTSSSSTTVVKTASSSIDPFINTRNKMKEILSKREKDWKNEYKKQYSEHYEKLSKGYIYTKEYRQNHIISKYVKEHLQYKQDIENGRLDLYEYEEYKIPKSDVLKKLNPDMDFEYHYYNDDKGPSTIQPTIFRIIQENWDGVLDAITDIYPPERIQEWLRREIVIEDLGDIHYFGTPLEYCLFTGKGNIFQLIWQKLDVKDSFIGEEKKIQNIYIESMGNKLLEYDGSLVKRWFLYDHVPDYDASYKMLQLLYSKIQVFDMIPTVVNNTLERVRERVRVRVRVRVREASYHFLIFYKEVTGFKLILKNDIKIRNMWKHLSYDQFDKLYEILEPPDELLEDLLEAEDDNNNLKLEKLFGYNTNDLSFRGKVRSLHNTTKDHRKFNILVGKLESHERHQYAASVLNINEQEKLLKRLKLERGKTKDIILKYLRDIKEVKIEQKEGEKIVSLKEIEFSAKATVSDPELEEMSKMGVDKIPFCWYEQDGAKENIDKKKHKGLQYFLVKKKKKIVAFIAYEQYNVNEYYIAWESATHPGYAKALKLLVFCHAYDARMISDVTLDLCGGHWLSHPNARYINLKFGFRYNDLQSVYDQAEILCAQNDCSLKELPYLIFKKDKTTVTNDEYKDIRKMIYEKTKNDNYPMSCAVTVDHIIKLLVIVQESQCGYLRGKVSAKKRAQLKSDIHATNDLVGGSSIEGRDAVNTMLNRERKRKRKRQGSRSKFNVGDFVRRHWTPKNGETGTSGWYEVKIKKKTYRKRLKMWQYFVKWTDPEWAEVKAELVDEITLRLQ